MSFQPQDAGVLCRDIPDDILFGRSLVMAQLRKRAAKIAAQNIAVLLCGQPGTGKEAIARWIHSHSCYAREAFVKINCAAIPGSLLESELFGYAKGAFTGAYMTKPGRIEQAHKGTLFLDDISDLDFGLQSKLLHFLQDGKFSRLGEDTERAVETRIICATNKSLVQEVAAGRFRADLYYRINVVELKLPSLRERREDIPLLAEYFREQHQSRFERNSEPLSPNFRDYLQDLPWPGNVHELSNTMARYVLVGMEALPLPGVRETAPAGEMNRLVAGPNGRLKRITKEAVRQMEQKMIRKALEANQWNRRKAAEALKISYRSLMYKLRNREFPERSRLPE